MTRTWLCGCSWSTSSSNWRWWSLWSSTIGFGWTVLLLVGTFALGSRAGRLAGQAPDCSGCGPGWPHRRAPSPTARWSRSAPCWSFVPGLVTSVAGPAAAAAAHPRRSPARCVTALAARGLAAMPLVDRRRGGSRCPRHGRARRLHRRRGDRRRRRRHDDARRRRRHRDVDARHCLARPTELTTLLVDGRVHSPAMPDATAMAVSDGPTASSRGSAPTTSAARSSPTPTSSISTAASSRRRSSTATSISPRPGLPLAGLDLRAATSRTSTACGSSPITRGAIPTGRSGATAGTSPAGRTGAPPTHRRPRRAYSATGPPTWPASTCTRRWRRRRCGALAPGLASATGFDPQRPLTADAHHLVRAAARELLDARAAARRPASPPSTWPPRSGIVAVHECAGPEIGGLDDWQELRDARSTASRSSATGARRSHAPRQARDLIDDDRRARAGGRPLRRRRARLAHRVAARAVRRRAGRVRQLLPRRRRHRGAPGRVHRGRDHRGLPRDRRRRGHARSSTRWRASSSGSAPPPSRAAGTASSTWRW